MVDRAKQIEQLIARYGLVTVEALSASIFRGLSDKAAERVITRLLTEERIRSQPLVGRRSFYTLTAAAARNLGVDADRCHLPLGAQAILEQYAMMAFCLLVEPQHERLMRREFLEKFDAIMGPGAVGRVLRTRYYLDKSDQRDGVVRLSLMVPDLGSHPRRLIRKARRKVEQRLAAGGSSLDLVRQGLFSVTVLTGFEAKARQLTESLRTASFHSRVVVVPGFGDLLTSD